MFRIKGRLVYLNLSEWWTVVDSETPRDSFSYYMLWYHGFKHTDIWILNWFLFSIRWCGIHNKTFWNCCIHVVASPNEKSLSYRYTHEIIVHRLCLQLFCCSRLDFLWYRCSSLLGQCHMLSMVELVLWFSLLILSTTLTIWSSAILMMNTLGPLSLFISTFWTCSFPSWGFWGRQTINHP